MKIKVGTISKEDTLKAARAARRLETVNLHPKTHADKRDKRKGGKREQLNKILKDL